MKKNVLIVFFALLFAPLHSHAQGLGSILGRVTDPAGAGVAGAQVTATQQGTGFSRAATTDPDGLYVIPSLQPAVYTLTVEAKGFSISKQHDITLLADQSLTVNVDLKLGAVTEIVNVTSNAVQVDTSTSSLKQVIEQQRISELPLNGRNAAQLTLLVAGAVNSPNGGADQGATKTFPGAVTYSTNGTRQDTISYQLDGGNYVDEYTNVNQPFPFPDALQEFSVQTSNYSAEYGQNAGGVVNVITKSGTNSFHGDAFEFVRNPAFNAQNYFATPTTHDQIKRNQFGGTDWRSDHPRQDLLLCRLSAHDISQSCLGQCARRRANRHRQLPGIRRPRRHAGHDRSRHRQNAGHRPYHRRVFGLLGKIQFSWTRSNRLESNSRLFKTGYRELRLGDGQARPFIQHEG